MGSNEIFNSEKLKQEIKTTWGEHGAHMEVFNAMEQELKEARENAEYWERSYHNTAKAAQKDFEKLQSISPHPQGSVSEEYIKSISFIEYPEKNINKEFAQDANHEERLAFIKGIKIGLSLPRVSQISKDKLFRAFKAGESWGVTYSTWFTPDEKDDEKKFNEFLAAEEISRLNH